MKIIKPSATMRSDTGGKVSVRRTRSTNPFETINELRRIIEEQSEHIASLEEDYAELEKDYAELKMKFEKQSEI